MSEQTIKNPFGDSISMSPISEDVDNQQVNTQIPSEGKEFQDEIKNKLAENGISEDTLKFGLNMGKQIVKNSKFVDYFSLEGDFKNDKREGRGIIYFANGDREMGNYLNDKKVGKHVKLTAKGKVTSSVY